MAELSSLFGELTKNVQIRIDKGSELQKQLFDKVLYTRFLDWDDPTIGLDFEELVGKYNITVVAPTIGIDSKEPILQTEGIETIKKSLMNHALTLPLSMKDYRKILQILDSKSISDKQKTKQLVNIMWGNVQTVVNSVEGKLDMIFLGLLSNHGVFTFDENNNPEGPIRGGISMNNQAYSNTVLLKNSTVGSVSGSEGSTGANNSSVTLENTIVNENVYGGKTFSGTATGNTVTLKSSTITNSIYGGFNGESATDVVTGNTLKLSGANTAGAVQNFATINIEDFAKL